LSGIDRHSLSGDPEKINEVKNLKMGSWFWWALFTAVIIGVADFLIKLLITWSDLYTIFYLCDLYFFVSFSQFF